MIENSDNHTWVIEANNLSKHYGKKRVIDDISFTLKPGQILGLIGPNGAGKTTLLKAILGMASCKGDLTVFTKNPQKQRTALLNDVCFIADTATLPRWMNVNQLIHYMQGVHPRFDKAKALRLIEKTAIATTSKVSELSKGMVTQLHLALIMAIDAKLLILDEPTLGLDIISRKAFYHHLLNDYFDGQRSIIITTHQVEEIESILTDVAFINHGKLVLNTDMKTIAQRYVQINLENDQYDTAVTHKPLAISLTANGYQAIYDYDQLATVEKLGASSVPSLADLFVMLVGVTAK